ncbi:hypothetical protein A2U01_0084855, partial [Trifolium medium]|nr:hypothetical protein [Trifolium medium]
NKIEVIKDPQGQIHYEEGKIEQILIDHFQNLFASQETHNIADTVQVVKDRINEDMYQMLSEKFTNAEVLQAIKDIKALAAPGPDG